MNRETTPQTGGWREISCELLLLGLTLVTLWNASSIFSENLLQQHLIILAVIAHAGWAITRRLKFPVILAGLSNAVVSLLAFAYLRYSNNAPRFEDEAPLTGSFLTNFSGDWDAALLALREEVVPLPLNTGVLFIVATSIFMLSGLAAWSAFRVRMSSADGILGYGFVFIGTMLFGISDQKALAALLFVLFALGFALAHRVFSNRRRAPVGAPALLGTGSLVIVFALGAGVVGGVSLTPPGEATRIDLASIQNISIGSGGPRVVLSPLVEIQSQLQTQSNVKLFTVLSDQPQYWRVTALDEFDGNSWRSSYSYGSASGSLNPEISSGQGETPSNLKQSFALSDFGTEWLPAAFEATRVRNYSSENFEIGYDGASSTLFVDSERSSVNGLTYSVVSDIPSYTTAQLQQVTYSDYNDRDYFNQTDVSRYSELPSDLSDAARRLAQEVTAEAGTPYGKALALQQWFREEFTYNLDVERGHSIDRVEDFLEVRQGYCEQFASTYAMMARMLDIPTRVVVGFTWGETDSADAAMADEFSDVDLGDDIPEAAFTVYGRHYHSWPEVLIPGAGWVLMEPTPSRGPPDSPHTQVGPQQAELTPAEDNPEEQFLPPEDLLPTDEVAIEDEQTASVTQDSTSGVWWLIASLVLAAVALLLAVLPVKGVLYLRRIQNNTAEMTLLAWHRAQLVWRRAGVARADNMTIHEFAERVSRQSDTLRQRNPLRQLADLTANVSYGEKVPSRQEAEAAEQLRQQVAQQAVLRIPKWKRLLGFGVTSPLVLGGKPKL